MIEQTCLQNLVSEVLSVVEHLPVKTKCLLDAADTDSCTKPRESLTKFLQVRYSSFGVLRECLHILQ